MTLEPFTYFKNEKEGRAFILVQCPTVGHPNEDCILIEWGKSRDQAVRIQPDKFEILLNKGLIKPFTPTISNT